MKILVTGASGFIGSRFLQMSKEYLHQGDEIIPLTSRPIEGYNCILHNNYRLQPDSYKKAGIDRVDVVVHIGHFLAEKNMTMSECEGNISSIMNTVHLLDTLPGNPIKIVYCSTMGVYGINRQDMVDETSFPMPQDVYSTSKLMIEYLLKEWTKKREITLKILRLSHIYGPGDTRMYTIPIWLRAASKNEAIKLFANSRMKRNCLYIDDCCRFIFRAIYSKDDVEIINLASSHTSTMGEIAELCHRISNNAIPLEMASTQKGIGQCGLDFKNTNLREKVLGQEQYTLEEGLKIEYKYLLERG